MYRHLDLHNGLYWQLFCCEWRNIWRNIAGKEESPVNYSKRNIKCENFDMIWAKHDKPMFLTREQQTGTRNEEEMDLLTVVIYDQLPVYLQIQC